LKSKIAKQINKYHHSHANLKSKEERAIPNAWNIDIGNAASKLKSCFPILPN
jgi:hypothetical protein